MRNQVGAIIGALGWIFLVEPLLGIIPGASDTISRWFPSGAAAATAGMSALDDPLGQLPAGLLLAAYALAVRRRGRRPDAAPGHLGVSLAGVLPRTAGRLPDGRLAVGGCALADVAAEHGTPVFVIDEDGLRATAREYLAAFASRHPATDVHFATKALPCAPVMRILAQEGLGCDVASAGELAIALSAGFDPAHVLLHGNAKRDADLVAALEAGVGLIVIDGPDDVDRLARLAPAGQRVLVRVNPSVPGLTHAAMDTGSPEAKFGVALADAPRLLDRIAATPGLELIGLHVHIGSQLLDLDGFGRAAAALAALGRFPVYDLGGGLGIAYTPEDTVPSIADYAAATVAALTTHLDPGAQLIVEPGRSLVGRSGSRLLGRHGQARRGDARRRRRRHGRQPRADALRPALLPRDPRPRPRRPRRASSSAITARAATCSRAASALATPEVGDLGHARHRRLLLLAAEQLQRHPRPPVVVCAGGDARLAVRRETYVDMLARDLG